MRVWWLGLVAGFVGVMGMGQVDAASLKTEVATFGAGCFWCVEAVFQELEGVLSVTPGYAGGTVANPSYEQVCTGTTGHAEAAQIRYDPARIRYEDLLRVFWKTHDPTTRNRQGPDAGTQYRSVIFTHDEKQRAAAESSKNRLEAAGAFSDPVVTEIVPLTRFYAAEEYHRNYFRNHPEAGYCRLVIRPKVEKFRKAFKDRLARGTTDWKAITDAEWKRRLTPEGYHILREKGTEKAFTGADLKSHEPGRYLCAGCGLGLFSSDAKFESGTGWPSFFTPVDPTRIEERTDRSFFMTRTEVLCARCGGHLGHVFGDGPPPTGLRYCINSAALTLEKNGRGE